METICKETQTVVCNHCALGDTGDLKENEIDECSYVQHRRPGFNILKAADCIFSQNDVFFFILSFIIVFFISILSLMR